MKRPNTQVGLNGSAARAAKQAPKITPAERAALKRLAFEHEEHSAARCRDAAAAIQSDADDFLTVARLLDRQPDAWKRRAATMWPSAELPPEAKATGEVAAFNHAVGVGTIHISGSVARALKIDEDYGDLTFTAEDVMGFDTNRLNIGDQVSFTLTEQCGQWTATHVEVLTSRAEDCECGQAVSLVFQVTNGVVLGGFTLSETQWNRISKIAGDWADAANDPRPCVAGFMEEAILAHLAKHEPAAGVAA